MHFCGNTAVKVDARNFDTMLLFIFLVYLINLFRYIVVEYKVAQFTNACYTSIIQ